MRNLALGAVVYVFAAVTVTIDATVWAALDAAKNVACCGANDTTDTGTNHGPNDVTASCGCANDGTAESANSRTLLGGGTSSERQGSGSDN